ncbi:MAG: fibronectin type III domain-containing protein [Acidimicrobiales bacterium]
MDFMKIAGYLLNRRILAPREGIGTRGFRTGVHRLRRYCSYSGHSTSFTHWALVATVLVSSGLAGGALGAQGASAAGSGSWSGPINVYGTTYPEAPAFLGMSCTSATFCVGFDEAAYATIYNGTKWSIPVSIDSKVNGNGAGGTSISCPSTTFCAAVDGMGYVVTYNGTTWSSPALIDPTANGSLIVSSVSCASTIFCAAVDTSGNAMIYNGTSWTAPVLIDPGSPGNIALESVSCPSPDMCVAVDSYGNALTYNGTTWSAPVSIDTYQTNTVQLNSVSCPTPSFCAAVDSLGYTLTFNGSAWTSPAPIDNDQEGIDAVSCASAKFCVAGISSTGGTYSGYVSYYDGTSWSSPVAVDSQGNLSAISCPSMAFCAAGDTYVGGNIFLYTNANTVPGAPTNVIATPAKATANLNWTAPASQGECPITSYEVDVYSGSTLASSVDTGSTSTSFTVTGLTNGTKYTFTVAATNCDGNGPASAASQPVIPSQPTVPAPYNPLTPYRICDTRSGNPSGLAGQDAQCAGKTLQGGTPLAVQVAGTNPNGQSAGGVPATGATAAVLNVTADNASAAGFFTIYPTGTAEPLSSNLNFSANEAVPNLVEVALGSSGQVSIFSNIASADVIVDVEGYVGPASAGAGLYNALTPARICDTRSGNPSGLSGSAAQCNADGPLAGGKVMTVQVTGVGNVPSTGVEGVVLNVTVAGTTASSFLTVWPEGSHRPTASNLNWTRGATAPNRVSVPLGPSGQVSIFNNAGLANVIVDVGGWYSAAGGSGSALTQFSGITPARILDTRQGSGEPYEGQTLQASSPLNVQVSGVGGVPSNATAVVLNVTVTHTSTGSYLTVWPTGTTHPTASDLNWTAGKTVPNLVIVKLGTAGQVSFFNNAGTVDVIADVVGWYQ